MNEQPRCWFGFVTRRALVSSLLTRVSQQWIIEVDNNEFENENESLQQVTNVKYLAHNKSKYI
jgi:hypothetical protein